MSSQVCCHSGEVDRYNNTSTRTISLVTMTNRFLRAFSSRLKRRSSRPQKERPAIERGREKKNKKKVRQESDTLSVIICTSYDTVVDLKNCCNVFYDFDFIICKQLDKKLIVTTHVSLQFNHHKEVKYSKQFSLK